MIIIEGLNLFELRNSFEFFFLVKSSYFSWVKVIFENIIEVKGVVDLILYFFIGY